MLKDGTKQLLLQEPRRNVKTCGYLKQENKTKAKHRVCSGLLD